MSLYLMFGDLQHEHPLELVDLQPNYPRYKEYEEEEDDDDDYTKWDFCSPCNLCGKEINLYQRYYYKCSLSSCNHFLHKWCGELPTMISLRAHFDRCDGTRYNRPRSWYWFNVTCETSSKDYEESEYNILNLPFWDQTDSLQKHLFFKETSTHHHHHHLINVEDNQLLTNCHQHPLRLVHSHDDDMSNQTTSCRSIVSRLHNPREKVELLCDGCVRPIMSMPFFQCTEDGCSSFVLHEWCTRLPPELKNHFAHPQHTLTLLPKVPVGFGVFICNACKLPCNGFAYGCVTCEDYYIDVTCAFLPEAITHEAHPNHLFLRVDDATRQSCFACPQQNNSTFMYKCRTCKDVYLHPECALLLPKTITHKYDSHPMRLSYMPIENHKSEYFCEICEEKFDPKTWFYHCSDECAQSLHPACAPLILHSERVTRSLFSYGVYRYVNIKFGRVVDNIKGHSHSLVFSQGVDDDGRCVKCAQRVRYNMIFKCLECNYVIHYQCEFNIYMVKY
uniref:uncharacterized protein LOC122583487 n=1 Tax=Erigeron canadensis TaxID=72917 RepID=UPI001CB91400|nr:uncharacterized protein LOC122583487 [Erigeron canadensis]